MTNGIITWTYQPLSKGIILMEFEIVIGSVYTINNVRMGSVTLSAYIHLN